MADFSHVKVFDLPTKSGKSKIATECLDQPGYCYSWQHVKQSKKSVFWRCLRCGGSRAGLRTAFSTREGAPIVCCTDPENPFHVQHNCSGPVKLVSVFARYTEQKIRKFLEFEGGEPRDVFREHVDAAVLCLPEELRSEFMQEIRPYSSLKRGFLGARTRGKEEKREPTGGNWTQNDIGLSSVIIKTLLTPQYANIDGYSPVCDLAIEQCGGTDNTTNTDNDPDYNVHVDESVLCKFSPKTRQRRRGPRATVSCFPEKVVSEDEPLTKREKVMPTMPNCQVDLPDYQMQNGFEMQDDGPQSMTRKVASPPAAPDYQVGFPSMSACADCKAKDELLLSVKKCFDSQAKMLDSQTKVLDLQANMLHNQTKLFGDFNGLISDLRTEIRDIKSKGVSHIVKNV